MSALSKIAADLRRLAEDAKDPNNRIDPFDLTTLARQVEAQEEMHERGLAE